MDFESLNHFKSVAVYQLFIAPADNDYLLARWMYFNRFPEFFWHACQAVEKYLKAGLVLNGKSVRKISHDLPRLYQLHCECFGELAPKEFNKPAGLDAKLWRDTSVEDFVTKIAQMGRAESRYGLASWSYSSEILFKLDQLCWMLRRTTIGLDWIVGNDWSASESEQALVGQNYRDVLRADPDFSVRGELSDLNMRLADLGNTRGDLLYSWNFEFRRCRADIFKTIPGGSVPKHGPTQNSYLFLFYQILSNKDEHGDYKALSPVFLEGMEWLLTAVKLSKGDEKEIEALLAVQRVG